MNSAAGIPPGVEGATLAIFGIRKSNDADSDGVTEADLAIAMNSWIYTNCKQSPLS